MSNNNYELIGNDDCDLIGFNNGVYDLKNGIFRVKNSNDNVLLSVGYDYKDNYTYDSPEIKQLLNFFEKVFVDEELREYCLLSFASFLNGYTDNQKFRFFIGLGANGKTAVMALLKKTFGDYFGFVSDTSYEYANCTGKRILVVQEPSGDINFIKNYKNKEVNYRKLYYRETFKYIPQCKIIVINNKMPNISEDDKSFLSNIAKIPFESEFLDKINSEKPNQFLRDYDLKNKINIWNESFMWLLINIYYKKYKENNYTIVEPNKVKLS